MIRGGCNSKNQRLQQISNAGLVFFGFFGLQPPSLIKVVFIQLLLMRGVATQKDRNYNCKLYIIKQQGMH